MIYKNIPYLLGMTLAFSSYSQDISKEIADNPDVLIKEEEVISKRNEDNKKALENIKKILEDIKSCSNQAKQERDINFLGSLILVCAPITTFLLSFISRLSYQRIVNQSEYLDAKEIVKADILKPSYPYGTMQLWLMRPSNLLTPKIFLACLKEEIKRSDRPKESLETLKINTARTVEEVQQFKKDIEKTKTYYGKDESVMSGMELLKSVGSSFGEEMTCLGSKKIERQRFSKDEIQQITTFLKDNYQFKKLSIGPGSFLLDEEAVEILEMVNSMGIDGFVVYTPDLVLNTCLKNYSQSLKRLTDIMKEKDSVPFKNLELVISPTIEKDTLKQISLFQRSVIPKIKEWFTIENVFVKVIKLEPGFAECEFVEKIQKIKRDLIKDARCTIKNAKWTLKINNESIEIK